MKENVVKNLPGNSATIEQFFDREDLVGDSAGLAAVLSGLIENGAFNNNVPIAVTGVIDSEGNVKGIGAMKAKILIAEQSGFSYILIPEENEKEARVVKENEELKIEIIAVPSVENAVTQIEKLNKTGATD